MSNDEKKKLGELWKKCKEKIAEIDIAKQQQPKNPPSAEKELENIALILLDDKE